jgi:peptidoglycan-associated lipoprotein
MSILPLPALCAGALLLAACADSGSLGRRYFAPAPAASSGPVTPGEGTIDSNVGNTVYFDTDSALLQPEAQQMLQKQALWLQQYPQYSWTIEGHADERGTREYNLALGERRAQATTDYLVALGVDPRRLKTISYGKERPVCTDANEACWSQNRRAVTTLVD